jgi:hypothetical protein
MILGVDVSTVCCGWTVLYPNGNFLTFGYVQLKSEDDLYDRLLQFVHQMQALKDELNDPIEQIYVEEPAKVYNAGSSAHTMSILQRFNGMVCAMLKYYFGKKPQLIEVKSARRIVGITIPRKMPRIEVKKLVLEYVKGHTTGDLLWDQKKTGNPKDYCYDVADSYVIAKAGHLNGQNLLSNTTFRSLSGSR